MFEPTSRYYGIPTAPLRLTRSGVSYQISYVRRRIIPLTVDTSTAVEYTAVEGDRLDTITARYLGDPTQFWIVCDANKVMRPEELTETPGRAIRIPLVQL